MEALSSPLAFISSTSTATANWMMHPPSSVKDNKSLKPKPMARISALRLMALVGPRHTSAGAAGAGAAATSAFRFKTSTAVDTKAPSPSSSTFLFKSRERGYAPAPRVSMSMSMDGMDDLQEEFNAIFKIAERNKGMTSPSMSNDTNADMKSNGNRSTMTTANNNNNEVEMMRAPTYNDRQRKNKKDQEDKEMKKEKKNEKELGNVLEQMDESIKMVSKQAEKMEKAARKLREVESQLRKTREMLGMQTMNKNDEKVMDGMGEESPDDMSEDGSSEDNSSESDSSESGSSSSESESEGTGMMTATMTMKGANPRTKSSMPAFQSTMTSTRIEVCTGKSCSKHGADTLLQNALFTSSDILGAQVTSCKCLGMCKGVAPSLRINGVKTKPSSKQEAEWMIQNVLLASKDTGVIAANAAW
mmetsp:Transcript_20014/g.34430  ORF Transcript_20014/g.34430 Transcript_20014/m.34430 type:complete len:417 (-) Transcript_20014:115-1365(-)